jgi:hypothetical protein
MVASTRASVVARMERSAIRESLRRAPLFPGYAALHPGYACCGPPGLRLLLQCVAYHWAPPKLIAEKEIR